MAHAALAQQALDPVAVGKGGCEEIGWRGHRVAGRSLEPSVSGTSKMLGAGSAG
ncbi:MAG TPA: hypothetical protein VLD58_02770 [Gemmatimonadales bacterium]|nr:hypothetical protein [Gemmatimonadales bacterium]